jgi:hypothetical protein
MIACRVCFTPTETPEGYRMGDTLYCFGCQRRLDLLRKQTKDAQPTEAPTWTPAQEMELRQAQNYPWKSTKQILEHMRERGFFVCFREEEDHE